MGTPTTRGGALGSQSVLGDVLDASMNGRQVISRLHTTEQVHTRHAAWFASEVAHDGALGAAGAVVRRSHGHGLQYATVILERTGDDISAVYSSGARAYLPCIGCLVAVSLV